MRNCYYMICFFNTGVRNELRRRLVLLLGEINFKPEGDKCYLI